MEKSVASPNTSNKSAFERNACSHIFECASLMEIPIAKKVRVLITGTNTTLDNGETAISLTAIKNLGRLMPQAEFTMGSTCKQIDCQRWEKMLPGRCFDIHIIGGLCWPGIPRTVRALSVVLRYIPECLKADVCLDISGDGYSDVSQGGLFASISHSLQLFIGVIFRKPVIVYAQSIGPFKNRLTRFLAKFTLNKVDLVTVREDLTETYLRKLGLEKPQVILTADSAFLLEPTPRQEAEMILKEENVCIKDRVLVGIAVSQIIHKWAFAGCEDENDRYEAYIDVMARVADHLVEKLEATVVIFSQSSGTLARHDDRISAVEVKKRVRHKDNVALILGQYTPQELKGMIGCCQLLVSSKMHSAIAAISMVVPTIVLAYSHKTHGIFERGLHLKETVIDVTELEPNELVQEIISRVEYLWDNRGKVRKILQERIFTEKEKASVNVKAAAMLIKSRV